MADVYGRLTGQGGVCLATLGPGATNLVTGRGRRQYGPAPLVAISGQAATTRMHKESHQYLDLVNLFAPDLEVPHPGRRSRRRFPRWCARPSSRPRPRSRASATSTFPKTWRKMRSTGRRRCRCSGRCQPVPPAAENPPGGRHHFQRQAIRLILAGNGVIRAGPREQLIRFAEKLNIPVVSTFMAKGVVPFSHCLWLGAVGMQARDYVACGFDRADVIICVGYDMVEYPPNRWHPARTGRSYTSTPRRPRWTSTTSSACGVLGDIGASLEAIAALTPSRSSIIRPPASGRRSWTNCANTPTTTAFP